MHACGLPHVTHRQDAALQHTLEVPHQRSAADHWRVEGIPARHADLTEHYLLCTYQTGRETYEGKPAIGTSSGKKGIQEKTIGLNEDLDVYTEHGNCP